MRRSVDLITMGCSKNLVDSERLLFQLYRNGFRVFHNPKRLHRNIAIVNTCGFINDAKEESINMILELCKAKDEGRLSKLLVCGCLSERFFSELNKEIPQVDRYYGKFNYNALLKDLGQTFWSDCSTHRVITTPRHYAYLKISEGCDRKCAYCAIPIITGKHKSRPMEEIVGEVERLVAFGVKEFQVIAQELTYYGLDIYHRRALPELVEKIADVPGVKWLRLHYAYPNAFPTDLLRVMRERTNVCKYLDIALQHISNNVLQNMRRHTDGTYQRELLTRIREEVPGIALRTTFMVGFPGEGDAEFEELLDFTREMRFEHMGAFAYSEEEDTWAALHLDDMIPETVKRERLSELMALQQTISEEICANRVGKTMEVIIDRKESDFYVGRTEYDSPEVDGEVFVSAQDRRLFRGCFYDVEITGSDEFDLYGNVVPKAKNDE